MPAAAAPRRAAAADIRNGGLSYVVCGPWLAAGQGSQVACCRMPVAFQSPPAASSPPGSVSLACSPRFQPDRGSTSRGRWIVHRPFSIFSPRISEKGQPWIPWGRGCVGKGGQSPPLEGWEAWRLGCATQKIGGGRSEIEQAAGSKESAAGKVFRVFSLLLTADFRLPFSSRSYGSAQAPPLPSFPASRLSVCFFFSTGKRANRRTGKRFTRDSPPESPSHR